MANNGAERRRHFLLEGFSRPEKFTGRRGGPKLIVPNRDRQSHAAELRRQLETVRQAMKVARTEARRAGEREGLLLEFASFPDVLLAVESLDRASGIELRNVRTEKGVTYATVFVPAGQLDQFEKLITAYLEERKDKNGKPRDNQRLIDAIQSIRTATLRALWTDAEGLFPLTDDEEIGWEIWLARRTKPEADWERFRRQAPDLRFAPGYVSFPERTVVLASGSAADFKRSVLVLNSIGELRRAKETANFFDELPFPEQAEWVDELLSRVRLGVARPDTPYVCVLDTGANRGHPLLESALSPQDLHSVEPGWGVEDGDGHGTEMTGLALFGDLTPLLEGSNAVHLDHRLESVKLLRFRGDNRGESRHHGFLTHEAVTRPEVSAPSRLRVFSMAVTTTDSRDRGRPSSWSAEVDSLAAGAGEITAPRRLIAVSAGNIDDPNSWREYPASNSTDGVHDPAQAWNALTVGAYTELERITETGVGAPTPKAPRGGLSPFSTTSCTWEQQWPFKPDVVFEGGNVAGPAQGTPLAAVSLSLLTTHHDPTHRLLTTSNATSAATALAARMAAQIWAEYPELWPETVRGLIVHSAEWTETMRSQFLPPNRKKADFSELVRTCGFGVPDLERALWTLRNSVTLVAQEALKPFGRPKPGTPQLEQMRLHELPWPRQALLDLGNAQVEMRVTLSYFIEPNPSRRGSTSRYRYESHGLRFDMNRPLESRDRFRRRINVAALAEDDDLTSDAASTELDREWTLGTNNRHRGSIHSDLWRGDAAKLAERQFLAVFPTSGWWKLRTGLKAWDRSARYALIVSIRSPEVEADLLAEIASQISVSIEV